MRAFHHCRLHPPTVAPGCHNASACPVPGGVDMSRPNRTEQLRFFSVEQALMDAAGLHAYATARWELSSANRWITFGGSYPGILAALSRLRFPHLFAAAVASSAPVQAELEMRGYNDVVAAAYEVASVGGSEACRRRIAAAHARAGELARAPEGRAELRRMLELPADALESERSRRDVLGNGAAYFPAQGNDPACIEPACNIAKICAVMTHETPEAVSGEAEGDRALRALAALRKAQQGLAAKDQDNDPEGSWDLWTWQVCTEWGFLQTCQLGSRCMFTQGLLTLDVMAQEACARFQLGPDPVETVAQAVARTNARFGGTHILASNVLWLNGEVDPWTANSPQSLSPQQLALGQRIVVVEGASHHAWTHPSASTDQPSVVAARAEIRAAVRQWLATDTTVDADQAVA
jgi:serine protease 16